MWLGEAQPPPDLPDDLGEIIAFPGLVNSHDHLDFNCYAPTGLPPYADFVGWAMDVQAAREVLAAVEQIPLSLRRRFGLLKNLLWGVTAVADHGGEPQQLDDPIAVLTPYKDLHSPEFGRKRSWLGGSTPVVMHLAEGSNSSSRRRALAYLRWNLRRRPVAGVHGVSLQGRDFDKLAALIWCPASNLFLFGKTADAAEAARRTDLLFGTDSTLSAPGTLWDHLRTARETIGAAKLFSALTAKADTFWNLPARHDFVVARRRRLDPWEAFFAVTPEDILLVVKDGQPVLADRSLGAPGPGFHALGGKYVRLPLPAMIEEVGRYIDPAALISRFTGAASPVRLAL
jgi:cytosine/adenosine deaminase-related metal-dependent hydrolase